MSLTASMWTSVSGLLAHGERMNVIGNNISNVNTVGFKGQRMDFADFAYQYTGTLSGVGQVGRGTMVGIVMNDWQQGSMETTTSSTDLAIDGNGFFKVVPKNSNQSYYTRAGNFTFDNDGYLVDPNGYVLQGWGIDSQVGRSGTGIVGSGAPTDVRLDTFTCPPRHTTNLTLPVNLRKATNATQDDNTTDATDPFFALLKTWDATQTPPLGTSQYAFQTTIEVYDEAGKAHKLTVYFDRVASQDSQYISGNSTGESYWEFIVTMDPSEDVRDFNSVYDTTGSSATNPNVPDALKGLLGSGTMTFNSSGEMKDMTFFVPQSDPTDPTDQWWTGPAGQEVIDLNKWVSAPISSNGYPMIAPNFSGTGGQQNPYFQDAAGIDTSRPNNTASDRMIEIDLGLRLTTNSWQFTTGAPLPANTTWALNPSASVNGVPMTAGNMSTLNLGGALYTETGILDPAEWTARTDSAGFDLYLHLITDTRAGYPSSYYVVDRNPPTLQSGMTVAASEQLVDPVAAVLSPSGTGAVTAYPVDRNGNKMFDVLYDTSHPNASATDTVTLYYYEKGDVPGEYYYTTNAAGDNPGDIITGPATGTPFAKSLNPTDLSTSTIAGGALTSAGLPQTAGAPVEVNTYGQLYDITTLPNPPYQTTQRVDANGDPLYLCLIQNTTDPTKPSSYYVVSTDANPTHLGTVTSSNPIMEPDPTILYPKNSGLVTAGDIGNSKYHINGMDGLSEKQQITTTCYGDNNYEHSGKSQDGYTYGDLRFINVDGNGILTATYSNGQTLELFQITLHDFPSLQNLRREGGNLYSETLESGSAYSGAAGTGTFGTTKSYSLEGSNVDLSREFVNMITTQRGFQANSKNITTVDTMLETVINMKR